MRKNNNKHKRSRCRCVAVFYIPIQLFITFLLIYANQKARTFLVLSYTIHLGSVAAVLRAELGHCVCSV